MKKNKKIIIIVLILLVILTLGYVAIKGINKTKSSKQIKDFEDYAVKYYNEYMSGLFGTNEVVISLKSLRKISEKQNYDLSSLKKCDENSSIIFTIDNKKIINKKIDLKCN